MTDDPAKSARQIARGNQRKAGDRSARLANALMKLSTPDVKKLELDEELREAVDRARGVKALIARRRAERTLAGDLRRSDLGELEQRLARLRESGHGEAQPFHQAEQWRARMIEEGVAALASFPGGDDEQLPRLIHAAQRERTTGRPPGAARALFRHIVQLLKTPRADSAGEEVDDG